MRALLFLTLSGAAWAGPELSALEAASHVGTLDGEEVRWTSALRTEGPGELRFAWPLPEGARVVRAEGAALLRDAEGRPVGLQVDGVGFAWLETVTPLDPARLQPPLILDGEAPQRISLDEAWFRAGPESGLTWGVDHQTDPELSGRQRRAADRALGDVRDRVGRQPLYVVADAGFASLGGVPGDLRRAGEVPAGTAAAVGVLFLLTLAMIGAAVRALGRFARREQVERYIRSELEPEGPGLSR